MPGEYCPGDFSVNDGHGHKLVGTAQRLVRGAWLFSVVIVVTDPDPIRDVLVEVYRELKLEWDPGTVGAVGSTAYRVTVHDVKAALLRTYRGSAGCGRAPWRPVRSTLRRPDGVVTWYPAASQNPPKSRHVRRARPC